MEHYLKLSLRSKPSNYIILVGMNDLTSEKISKEIAESTVPLTSSLKSETYDVSVLLIIIKMDNKQLNQKDNEVNA